MDVRVNKAGQDVMFAGFFLAVSCDVMDFAIHDGDCAMSDAAVGDIDDVAGTPDVPEDVSIPDFEE